MPVLDHEINEKVRIYSTEPYGCSNKPRGNGYYGQDGWYNDGTRKPILLKDGASIKCRYDKRPTDPRCGDCNLPSDEEYFKEMGL
jgi:hypothetical protein